MDLNNTLIGGETLKKGHLRHGDIKFILRILKSLKWNKEFEYKNNYDEIDLPDSRAYIDHIEFAINQLELIKPTKKRSGKK